MSERVRALVATRGTQNQVERLDAGLLPEYELTSLARHVLYEPLASLERWEPIRASEVEHLPGCYQRLVRFSTRTPEHLSADEWTLYRQIQTVVEAMNQGHLADHATRAEVSLVEHVGACGGCGAEAYGRSARVAMIWEGHPLAREYSLEAPSTAK